MKPRFFAFVIASLLAGCSKHNEDMAPPNSNNITVTISFPDGRNVTSTDYAVQASSIPLNYQINGTSLDTIEPVAWLNTNNVENGWDFYTYGFWGNNPGKSYKLIFSTPTYFDNVNVPEFYDFYRWDPSLAWTLGSVSLFKFEGSTYEITKLTVSTTVKDSTTSTISGTFTVIFSADSVFTATSRTAYSYPYPFEIDGTYNNISLP